MEKITMNARKVAMIAAALSIGLFTLEEKAMAENGANKSKPRRLRLSTGSARQI
jgi:hypothetical protein